MAREQSDLERWFVRRGLPHFIEDYRARHDVWTRCLPVLVLLYVAGIAIALNRDYSAAANTVIAAGSVIVLLGTWATANVARHRRAFSRPHEVGAGELGVFVLGPTLLPLIFGGHWRESLATAAGGLVLLAVLYVVVGYGLVPMTVWAAARLVDQLAALGNLLVRTLPLLLLFTTFLFVNAEVWDVAGDLYGVAYAVVTGLFFVFGAVFVSRRLRTDVGELAHFEDWAEVDRTVADAPAPARQSDATAPTVPLGRREWINVALVALVSQGIQVTLVALVIGVFFVVFGLFAIEPDTVQRWTAEAPHALWTTHLGGRELVLTEELLRVSGFLAAFTGLYFTVYLVTDATYRAEFRDEVVGELRQAFAVRACQRAR